MNQFPTKQNSKPKHVPNDHYDEAYDVSNTEGILLSQ